jgi:hypothetical protein
LLESCVLIVRGEGVTHALTPRRAKLAPVWKRNGRPVTQ